MSATVDTLARLRHELAAMHDPIDVPGDWTPRQRDDYEGKRSLLRQRIVAVRDAAATLAEVAAQVEAVETWLHHLTTWRRPLADELLALQPNPRTDTDRGRQQNLMLSIRCIDHGTGVIKESGYALDTLRLGALMRESGYVAAPPAEGRVFGELPWFGSTAEVEFRLKQLAARRAEAEARLADGLLDDEARASRDAERKTRAARLNAMSKAERALATS